MKPLRYTGRETDRAVRNLTTTTETIMAYGVSGVTNVLDILVISNASAANPATVEIRGALAGTPLLTLTVPANGTVSFIGLELHGAIGGDLTCKIAAGTSPNVNVSFVSFRA